MSRHITTHIDEWFEEPKNKDMIQFLYKTKSTVIRHGGSSKDEPKTKWAYCLHCKKGSFLGIKSHKPSDFVIEHKHSSCSHHFSEHASRFEPYIIDEEKPCLQIVEDKPNTEMIEMKALIEKLQAENKALKAAQQKPVAKKDDDDETEEDMTLQEEVKLLKVQTKNLSNLVDKLKASNREAVSNVENWVMRLDIDDKHQFDRVYNEMSNFVESYYGDTVVDNEEQEEEEEEEEEEEVVETPKVKVIRKATKAT
jgi:hypothetical protein